jgi:hypothetical protein
MKAIITFICEKEHKTGNCKSYSTRGAKEMKKNQAAVGSHLSALSKRFPKPISDSHVLRGV